MSSILNKMESGPRQYAVFISYRHADNLEMGRKWANWLHEALESYEVPPDLVGKTSLRGDQVPASLYPVFRDEVELPADADLSTSICRALENSGLLVVLCSPRAVQSKFVADEIRFFKEQGKSHRILALMIDGEPNASDDPSKRDIPGPDAECFPEPLRFGVPAQDDPMKIDWTARTEPIAADVRPEGRCVQGWTTAAAYHEQLAKDGSLKPARVAAAVRDYAERLELAKLKVIAGALGVPLGGLTQRDKAYQLKKQKHQARVLRRWLVLVGAVGLAALAGGFFAYRNGIEADLQRDQANAQRLEVTKERDKQDELLWKASRGEHEDAMRLFRAGNRSQGLAKLLRAGELQPKNVAALAASGSYLFGLSSGNWQTRSTHKFAGSSVLPARFSRDGSVILVPTSKQELTVMDPATGRALRTIQTPAVLRAFAISPDGSWLAAGCDNEEVILVDVHTGKAAADVKWHTLANSIEFSPDGKHLAIGSAEDDTVLIEDPLGKRALRTTLQGATIRKVLFSADGSMVASLADQKFWIMSASKGGLEWAFDIGTKVVALQFTPDGRFAVVGAGYPGNPGVVLIVDTQTGKEVSRKQCGYGLAGIAVSPDGAKIAGLEAMSVWIADRQSMNEIGKVLFSEATFSNSIQFSPDGRFLAAGQGHALKLMESESAKVKNTLMLSGDIGFAEFSADGRWLAVSDNHGSLRIAEPEGCPFTGEWQCLYEISSLAFSADSKLLAIGGSGGRAKVVEAAGTREVASFEFDGMIARTWAVAFGRTGNQLAVALDETILGMDVPKPEPVFRSSFKGNIGDLAFSPDGTMIAASDWEGTLRVLEAEGGHQRTEVIFGGRVLALGFSPDNKWLAAASEDHTLRVIDPSDGRELLKQTFPEEFKALAVSTDGRLIASAGAPGKDAEVSRMRVIEVSTGQETAHADFGSSVWSVDFSPDSRFVVAGSSDRTLRVIDARSGLEQTRIDYSSSELLTNYVDQVKFSRDARWIVAVVDGSARIVEADTGNQISRIDIGDSIKIAALSLDSRWLALGSNKGIVRVYDLSWLTPGSERLGGDWSNFQALIAGQHLDKDGRLGFVSDRSAAFGNDSSESQVVEKPAPSNQWQRDVLAWRQMDAKTRTSSPWTAEPLRSAVGRWLIQARHDTSTIPDCADLAPWHPLEPVSLARLGVKSTDDLNAKPAAPVTARSLFLARLTLKRLHEADEKLYGQDTLAEYAGWSANIMHEELNLDVEALEALNFALERTPTEKQGPLLELKAKIEAK